MFCSQLSHLRSASHISKAWPHFPIERRPCFQRYDNGGFSRCQTVRSWSRQFLCIQRRVLNVHRAAKVTGHVSGDRSSTLGGIRQLVFLPEFQTGSGGTQPAFQTKLSPEVKRSKPEGDHSPASRAKIRNRWSYTPASPMCFNIAMSDSSTFPYAFIMWCCQEGPV